MALRTTGGVRYLLGDHLGSTSVTADGSGGSVLRQLYKAWGETRGTGRVATQYGYTGQYGYEDDFGLLFYRARWYDPYLTQFSQPDTLVPDQYNPLDWNRYQYARANPLKYTDASGHATCDEIPDAEGQRVCYENQLQIPQVMENIYEEMKRNSKSNIVNIMRLENSCIDMCGLPKIVAYSIWASMVAPGREWDHKSAIRRTEIDAGRDPEYQRAGDYEFHFDVWSNIHYGYVGMAAGFSSDELLDGAGLAQYLDDIRKAHPQEARSGVEGWEKYDQATDSASIQLGIDLWLKYGYELTLFNFYFDLQNTTKLRRHRSTNNE